MNAKAEVHDLVEGLSEPEAEALLTDFVGRNEHPPTYRHADGSIDFERLWRSRR